MNKKLIALAIGMAAANAHATVLLGTDDPISYASETVAANTATVVGTNTFRHVVVVAATPQSEVGFGFAANTSFWVRYQLSGAVFETPVTNTDLTLSTFAAGTYTVAQGGAANSAYVIIEVNSAAITTVTDTLELALVDLKLGSGSATVSVTTHSTAVDAVNSTNALATTSGTLITQESGLTTTFSAQPNAISDVNALPSFTDFFSSPANLGSFATELANAVNADDGANVELADVVAAATSSIVFTGDFSMALTASGGSAFLSEDSNCGTVNAALVVNTLGTTATRTDLSGGRLEFGVPLFLCIAPDGSTEILASDAFTTVLTTTAGASGTVAPQSGTLAGIDRNGTTLKVAYATTFEGYNQRVVITNNGAADKTYVFSFSSEDGVTAAAGAAATGTLPAGEVTVIKMSDAVTFTGGSRGSAQIVIPAVPATIQAAVTQVNIADGATDTVQLQ